MITQIIDDNVTINYREPLTEADVEKELSQVHWLRSADEYPAPISPGTKWPSESKAPWRQIESYTLGKDQSCRLFQAIRARSKCGKGQTVALILGIPTIVKAKSRLIRALVSVW
jgi:hypothetical protein